MIKRKRAITLLLAVALFLSIWVIPTEQVFAKVALPAISPSRYIAAYTRASSGKVYAYTDSSLSQKTGGYIECATDECYIIEIKGNALKVSYPTPGKRKTKWFEREAFTYRDLASYGAKTKFKSTKKVTTYKRKDKNNKYGYIAKGDICYLLRGDEASDWLQVIYPTGNTYKMAWVKGVDIRTVIWPPQNNTTIEPTGVSLSKSSIKDYVGSSYKLSATVSPSNAANKSVSWSTGNSGIATVDGSGNVKLKAAGSTSITARTSNGKTASCSVTVIEKANPEPSLSNEKAVRDRLDKIAKGKYKLNSKTVLQVGKKFVGTRSNEQCKGYAKDVFYCCFKIWPGSTMKKPNNHKLNKTSGMKLVATTSSVTEKSAKKLFSNARPGDFVQIRRSHTGSHSAILYKVTSSGVTFIEANLDGKNTIYKKTYTWKALAKNAKMSVYTATSYKLK